MGAVARKPSGETLKRSGVFCWGITAQLKPIDGHLSGPPGVGPFHDSEEAVPDRFDASDTSRIIAVHDGVAGVQFDPVANLSIEAVHRSPCHCALNGFYWYQD